MSSETYAIPFDDNETIDLGTSVFSNDQIQTIMESGDTTLSYPFELAEYPSPDLDPTYDPTHNEEIYSPILDLPSLFENVSLPSPDQTPVSDPTDNDNNGLLSIEDKDVLQPFQDQLPVSEQTVDHQILVSNQPERNVRFR